MATSMTRVRVLCRRRNNGLFFRVSRLPIVSFTRSSSDEEPKLVEQPTEDENRIRNVSRMPEHLWKLMNGNPMPPDELLQHQTQWVTNNPRRQKRILQKHYGKHGSASGVDPGILWPTKKELSEMINTEKKLYPSLQEMVTNVQTKLKEQQEERDRREVEVAANYAKLQTWIKDLEDRQAKKLAEAKAQKEKKEKLIEEVRAYFGYRIDPKDERFKELLEKKEKEEKKALKEAKKKEKIAKEWEKITKMAEEAKAKAAELKPKSDIDQTSSQPVSGVKPSSGTEEK